MIDNQSIYIVSAARTPLGSFLGSLSPLTSTELGIEAVKGAVNAANINPEQVEEIFYGNVVSANAGLNPAKEVAIGAGLGNDTISTMVNKACASSMKAIMLGAQSIAAGESHIIVAAGSESMSNAPFYDTVARKGHKYGPFSLTDSILRDGLSDARSGTDMGTFAEDCAAKYNISREEQDEFAINSYQKVLDAQKEGLLDSEIVSVSVPAPRGKPAAVVSVDDEPQKLNAEKLKNLRPVFKASNPTITAGNASPISDGAAAVVLASAQAVQEFRLKPIARIVSYADAEQEPRWFTTSPSLAIRKALEKAKLDISAVDLFEINEAFSVVALANMQILNLPLSKLNVLGGAVGLGHPIGCSGARVTATLINALRAKKGKFGVASICNGGGGASAIVIEYIPVLV